MGVPPWIGNLHVLYICCKITQQPELSVGRNVELHNCVVGSVDINICSYLYIIYINMLC